VRDALFLAPSGVTLAGDIEVHLRASDFARHGHATDPAYSRVVLHLCWVDDRDEPGSPTLLPDGPLPPTPPGSRPHAAPTVALAPYLDARAVERLVARGPDVEVTRPPCADV